MIPVAGSPLLLAAGERRVLVAADIHLGIEYELWQGGASIKSQTDRLLLRLKDALKDSCADMLLILGDLKHNIPRTSFQERQEVPLFLKSLQELAEVAVIPGNHDGGLVEMLPPKVRLFPPGGAVIDGYGYFHGHTWPSPDVFKARAVAAGHIHPAVRLTDALGYSKSRQVWAKVSVSSSALKEHYMEDLTPPELVIVPAFNPLCGGLPLNRPTGEERGPVLEIAEMCRARIYMLDGTDLGNLGSIQPYAHPG